MRFTSTRTRRQFFGESLLAAGSLVASAPFGLAQGPVGVPAERLKRLRKGANVCRWFRFPAEQSGHLENYISEAEADWMARMGLTHVRLCVAPGVVMDAASGALREKLVALLEAAIRRFHRAGLLVMVDLHNEDRAVELDPAWQDAFVRFWGALAGRLAKFDPELTMLEFINEPVFAKREDEWNTLNARLAVAIRERAPQHTLVTSGPNWGGIDGLRKLKLLSDRNVVYSFHCYDPFTFTHQGATWSGDGVKPLRAVPYPSSPDAVAPLLSALEAQPGSMQLLKKYGEDHWDRAKLAARFQRAIEWGTQNGVPLYCGEFGVFPVHARPEHRANWFRDFGSILEEKQVGWSVWGWDEGFGLNRRLAGGKPVVDAVVAGALGLRVS